MCCSCMHHATHKHDVFWLSVPCTALTTCVITNVHGNNDVVVYLDVALAVVSAVVAAVAAVAAVVVECVFCRHKCWIVWTRVCAQFLCVLPRAFIQHYNTGQALHTLSMGVVCVIFLSNVLSHGLVCTYVANSAPNGAQRPLLCCLVVDTLDPISLGSGFNCGLFLWGCICAPC